MAKVTVWQNGLSSQLSADPGDALSCLLRSGHSIPHPCGGRGSCGKCAVKLEGSFESKSAAGGYLLCQTVITGDMTVYLPDKQTLLQIESGTVHIQKPLTHTGIGAAVDIGTTTLVLQLYDRSSEMLLAESAAANPQTEITADVIGRIDAALNGKGEYLKNILQQAISSLLEDASRKAGIQTADVAELVVTGNTTMLYLLMGFNTGCLSHAPFRADNLFDTQAQLLDQQVYLPPCISAFVGADISCAIFASGMCGNSQTALLCDVGTNGELALWHNGKLYVTSTAAGPAFEGVGISCGCTSIDGAIDRVWIENGAIKLHTLGTAPARGLCGSGLIDAVAALLMLELVDETGAMERPHCFSGNVCLTPEDIRQVQLAKAAISAGIETLLQVTGISAWHIDKVFLAGGFGSHMRGESAAAIGLIPAALLEKLEILGNAALTGAVQLLLHPQKREEVRKIAKTAQLVHLGGNPIFNEKYIENLLFPEL